MQCRTAPVSSISDYTTLPYPTAGERLPGNFNVFNALRPCTQAPGPVGYSGMGSPLGMPTGPLGACSSAQECPNGCTCENGMCVNLIGGGECSGPAPGPTGTSTCVPEIGCTYSNCDLSSGPPCYATMDICINSGCGGSSGGNRATCNTSCYVDIDGTAEYPCSCGGDMGNCITRASDDYDVTTGTVGANDACAQASLYKSQGMSQEACVQALCNNNVDFDPAFGNRSATDVCARVYTGDAKQNSGIICAGYSPPINPFNPYPSNNGGGGNNWWQGGRRRQHTLTPKDMMKIHQVVQNRWPGAKVNVGNEIILLPGQWPYIPVEVIPPASSGLGGFICKVTRRLASNGGWFFHMAGEGCVGMPMAMSSGASPLGLSAAPCNGHETYGIHGPGCNFQNTCPSGKPFTGCDTSTGNCTYYDSKEKKTYQLGFTPEGISVPLDTGLTLCPDWKNSSDPCAVIPSGHNIDDYKLDKAGSKLCHLPQSL